MIDKDMEAAVYCEYPKFLFLGGDAGQESRIAHSEDEEKELRTMGYKGTMGGGESCFESQRRAALEASQERYVHQEYPKIEGGVLYMNKEEYDSAHAPVPEPVKPTAPVAKAEPVVAKPAKPVRKS